MINLEDFWNKIQVDLKSNEYWHKKIFDTKCKIHLALMVEPYLSLILSEKKTIESRFSTKKITPFNNISDGDIVVLKKSSGDIVAIFEVDKVIFKQIYNKNDIEEIKQEYGKELCLEEKFWIEKKRANYATLIKISHLQSISPISIKKPNRQSWITYSNEEKLTEKDDNLGKIICIVGKIASGKTTLANELAVAMKGEQFSISDYLKYCLKEKGVKNPSRTQLQELGEDFISKGYENFCENFLKFISYDDHKTYIIDGIRHKNFFTALCNKSYPINPLLVFLNVDNEVLDQRKNERQEAEYDERRLAEGNLIDLFKLADIIIKTKDKNVVEIVDEILQTMESIPIVNKVEDDKIVLQDLKDEINEFNKNRNWNSYHNAMNLAMSINIEAAELLEIFQWSDKKNADEKARIYENEHLKEELADIIIYCINLANAYNIDISSCIIDKLHKNAKKYPPK